MIDKGLAYDALQITYFIKRTLYPQGHFLSVFALPKSASTYLCNLLELVTKYKSEDVVYRYGRNEQELYFPRLIDNMHMKCVTHSHTRATEHNLHLIDKFDIRPIIHVRNIFDMVVSLFDFFEDVPSYPKMFPGYTNNRYYELDEDVKFDMLVDLFVPWYINFYVSWYDASSHSGASILWTSFEQLIRNKKITLEKIIKFQGLEQFLPNIKDAITNADKLSKRKNRLNKGVKGRGNYVLKDYHREKIRSHTRFYPWVDFSRIGI